VGSIRVASIAVDPIEILRGFDSRRLHLRFQAKMDRDNRHIPPVIETRNPASAHPNILVSALGLPLEQPSVDAAEELERGGDPAPAQTPASFRKLCLAHGLG
jgi:hypothetical protein